MRVGDNAQDHARQQGDLSNRPDDGAPAKMPAVSIVPAVSSF